MSTRFVLWILKVSQIPQISQNSCDFFERSRETQKCEIFATLSSALSSTFEAICSFNFEKIKERLKFDLFTRFFTNTRLESLIFLLELLDSSYGACNQLKILKFTRKFGFFKAVKVRVRSVGSVVDARKSIEQVIIFYLLLMWSDDDPLNPFRHNEWTLVLRHDYEHWGSRHSFT